MADSALAADFAPAERAAPRARHAAMVRVTHWAAAMCFFALLVTGLEIVVSHPRFYWGETGNDLSKPLFQIPIPASRRLVPTGYDYVLPDENGWSRALHFQSAWAVVITGFVYVLFGLLTGHFRRNLVPRGADVSWAALRVTIADHLRFKRPGEAEAWSYNVLQRLSYLLVVFVVFPVMIWTGLAMSPAVVSAIPGLVTTFGGQQSARTIHFFLTWFLVLFVVVHVMMICLAGFGKRMRAMITGRVAAEGERG